MAFIDRIQPAPVGGGFRMDDYWVWGGSVIQGEDGRYHMFASRWPKTLPFFAGYQTHSEVVRAVADTPEGPYAFQEVVLPARGAVHWDGQMTHNPSIHRYGDVYLLFYIGATYPAPRPEPEALWNDQTPKPKISYANIRIGMATARAVTGPWRRPDAPVLRPRPGKWDHSIVTNPAPCVTQDGRILLLYRANTPQGLRIGAALAPKLGAAFERLHEDPVLHFEGDNHVEDPYVWWVDDPASSGGHFELLAKDMTGGITGERHAGVHATSPDGITWHLSDPPKAYSRRVRWTDGTETTQGCLERPQLLLQDGYPTHLFAATCDGPGGFRACSKSWTIVLPLQS
jgi:hypothetical protein